MGSPWLSRLAVAAAAAGALTLMAAAPAAAHDKPATGFDVYLHADHHGRLASYFEQKCAEIRGNDPDLVKAGYDAWVFNIPNGQFDTADGVITLKVTFEKPDGTDVIVEVPGTSYDTWIGPDANKHLVAVSVPAGWKLLDGDANVVDSTSKWFVVTHACAGTSTTKSPSSSAPASNGGSSSSSAPGGGGGLPVTGGPVGGILIAGLVLLGGGVALMAVRRRRAVSELTES